MTCNNDVDEQNLLEQIWSPQPQPLELQRKANRLIRLLYNAIRFAQLPYNVFNYSNLLSVYSLLFITPSLVMHSRFESQIKVQIERAFILLAIYNRAKARTQVNFARFLLHLVPCDTAYFRQMRETYVELANNECDTDELKMYFDAMWSEYISLFLDYVENAEYKDVAIFYEDGHKLLESA